jgi:tRNA1(Val) A37 N6-methylase TrmN6
VKGSRAPPALLPPLVLHDASGAYTPRAEAVHRGELLLIP